MVTLNPTPDELVGQDNTELTDTEFSYTPNHDNDLKEKALAMLFFFHLYSIYDKYVDKTPEYILEHIDQDMDKLNVQVKDNVQKNLETYKNKVRKEQLKEFQLTPKIKKANLEVKPTAEVLEISLTTIHEQLRNDAKTKAKVWIDRNSNPKEFNLNPNFKRAVSRYNTAFNYATSTVTQKSDRTIKAFVYTEETLYNWVCFGKHPCGWCIDQSKYPPRKLEDIPYDHINGWCGVVPNKPEFSQDYIDTLKNEYQILI